MNLTEPQLIEIDQIASRHPLHKSGPLLEGNDLIHEGDVIAYGVALCLWRAENGEDPSFATEELESLILYVGISRGLDLLIDLGDVTARLNENGDTVYTLTRKEQDDDSATNV